MDSKDKLLLNAVLSDEEKAALGRIEAQDHPWLFVVIGGISISSEFCRSALLVSDSEIMTYELDTGHAGPRISITDVEKAANKRMYGNAILRLHMKDGSITNVFRYTFTVNTICESAASFINSGPSTRSS